MKMAQGELKRKVAEEITTLKKENDHLVIKKAQFLASRGEVEEVIDVAFQHIHESTPEQIVDQNRHRLSITSRIHSPTISSPKIVPLTCIIIIFIGLRSLHSRYTYN